MTTLLTCSQCQALLPFFVNGQITSDEHIAVQTHLEECDTCPRERALWEALPAALTHAQGDILVGLSVIDAWTKLQSRLDEHPLQMQEDVPWDNTHSPVFDMPHLPTFQVSGRNAAWAPRVNGVSAALIVMLFIVVSSGLFLYLQQARSSVVTSPTTLNIPTQLSYHPTHVLTQRELVPNTYFYDVQMLSQEDGWAVGGTDVIRNNVSVVATAIYHYQHGRWIASPDIIPDGMLYSLSMVSPDDGWAAGGIYRLGADHMTYEAIMLHYDGSHWRQVAIPPHGQINKVQMVSASEGWAIANDDNEKFPFLHYQHGIWSDVDPTQATFYISVSMVSPQDGWVAGYQGAIGQYHNGQWTAWSQRAPGDVTCLAMDSGSDGWMIAETPENHTGKRYQQVIALHFDGTHWKSMPLATASLHPLITGIAFAGDTGWLAGRIEDDRSNVEGSVLFRETNSSWQLERFQVDAALTAISLSSPTEGWAVGAKNMQTPPTTSNSQVFGGVLLHYLNGKWTVYQV